MCLLVYVLACVFVCPYDVCVRAQVIASMLRALSRALTRNALARSLLARARPQHVLFGQQQRRRHPLHERVLVWTRHRHAKHTCARHEEYLRSLVRHHANRLRVLCIYQPQC